MNQASTVASVSPSVYYFLMYALILHIQVNFQCDHVAVSGCFWLFMAVYTASTQFLDIQYVSVAFQLNDQGFIQKKITGGEVGVAVSRTVTPPPIKN